RLGFWMGNPGQAGDKTYYLDSPRYSVRPIVAEAFGQTNDKSPYVYLSDGGHFENLGLYEMVLRRCRLIVVSDASTDTDYSFQSLGMAIRLIRIDFGVPVEFKKFDILKFSSATSPEEKRAYCATATIRYSCVDKRQPTDKDE